MREHLWLLIHLLFTLAKLGKPGGVKAVMAENIAMRQQLITLSRARKRAPKLSAFDRFCFGLMACFVSNSRLQKIAIILKPATFLNFHKALVTWKYRQLYSNKTQKKPGRKTPDQTLIDLVIEMKKRNPTFGYALPCRVSALTCLRYSELNLDCCALFMCNSSSRRTRG